MENLDVILCLIQKEKNFIYEIFNEPRFHFILNKRNKKFYLQERKFVYRKYAEYLWKVGVDYAITNSEWINFLYTEAERIIKKSNKFR